jgi:hypothetical protein
VCECEYPGEQGSESWVTRSSRRVPCAAWALEGWGLGWCFVVFWRGSVLLYTGTGSICLSQQRDMRLATGEVADCCGAWTEVRPNVSTESNEAAGGCEWFARHGDGDGWAQAQERFTPRTSEWRAATSVYVLSE